MESLDPLQNRPATIIKHNVLAQNIASNHQTKAQEEIGSNLNTHTQAQALFTSKLNKNFIYMIQPRKLNGKP